ncbi:hypothetical protein SDC9_198486 [bioreactor metagenome]|uniref:Uncharacterized protein n=1 Tax=bioreactor metagenome TaxID=1076179 RepID=A0A645IHS7_9ZZZZ
MESKIVMPDIVINSIANILYTGVLLSTPDNMLLKFIFSDTNHTPQIAEINEVVIPIPISVVFNLS